MNTLEEVVASDGIAEILFGWLNEHRSRFENCEYFLRFWAMISKEMSEIKPIEWFNPEDEGKFVT